MYKLVFSRKKIATLQNKIKLGEERKDYLVGTTLESFFIMVYWMFHFCHLIFLLGS